MQPMPTPLPVRKLPPVRRARWILLLPVVLLLGGYFLIAGDYAAPQQAAPSNRAAMTVTLAPVAAAQWAETVRASGAVAPWQEAIIGSEIGGQRLVELRVNVGARVKKGQVLARYNTATLQAEAAQLRALWKKADADHRRAEAVRKDGVLSAQQIDAYRADAASARALLDAKELQLRYATITAPEDGIISARSATLGAVGNVGGELFRLIVQNRLEWRGELTAEQLAHVAPQQSVVLTLPNGSLTHATVRAIAPSLDSSSRMGMIYADLEPATAAHAGMYLEGTIALAAKPMLTVPMASVLIRDGHSLVFVLPTGKTEGKVAAREVVTGQQQGTEIAILSGLEEGESVVVLGAGFLNDGDTVQVAPMKDNAGEGAAQ